MRSSSHLSFPLLSFFVVLAAGAAHAQTATAVDPGSSSMDISHLVTAVVAGLLGGAVSGAAMIFARRAPSASPSSDALEQRVGKIEAMLAPEGEIRHTLGRTTQKLAEIEADVILRFAELPPPAPPARAELPAPPPAKPVAALPPEPRPSPRAEAVVAPAPASGPEHPGFDFGHGPHRPAVEALYATFADFLQQATRTAPAESVFRTYWFLGTFEHWLLALRALSTEGMGSVPGADGQPLRLGSLEEWVAGFAEGWLDPVGTTVSDLAQRAIAGRASEEDRSFGAALMQLVTTGLPRALSPLQCTLVETVPFQTTFDDRRMVCDATLPSPDHRDLVVGINRMGVTLRGRVIRAPHVVVGA